MRYALAFNGTRGDIQPAVVVGVELRRRGHDVVFGAPPNLCDFVAGSGLDVRALGYDTRAHMNSDVVRTKLRSGGPRQRLRALAEIRDLGWAQIVSEMDGLADGADAVLTGFTTEQIARPFAESVGAKCISLHHAPIRPNRSVLPVPGVPPGLPGVVNQAGWWLLERMAELLTRDRRHKLRQRLGLPSTAGTSANVEVQAYDPLLCPEIAAEWQRLPRPFVGFLTPDESLRRDLGITRADPELMSWIADGSPPVYVGFGSMPVSNPETTFDAIVDVCRNMGRRTLINTGWNDVTVPSADDIRVTDGLDHDVVFPLCETIVHHGGAGTTAAALRAGTPSLVCWVGSDQPYWGSLCERHGVGASMRLKGLDIADFGAKLSSVCASAHRERALLLSRSMISPRDAASRCADAIEQTLRMPVPS